MNHGPEALRGSGAARPRPATWTARARRLPPWILAFGTLLVSLGLPTAFAATPAGYTEYIVPFDEDVFAYVTDPLVNVAIPGNYTTHSIVSMTAWSNNVTIYWDHWENGYGYDATDPDGAGTDEKYTLNYGQTLSFERRTYPARGPAPTATPTWAPPETATPSRRPRPRSSETRRTSATTAGTGSSPSAAPPR